MKGSVSKSGEAASRLAKNRKSLLAEFKNPNQQGGGDNKSLLVMMFVLVTVFFGLQYFRAKNNPQTASPNAGHSAPAAGGTQTPAQSAAPAAASASTAATPNASVSGVPAIHAPVEATTTVDNELYRITFTNRGGQVTSWILKKYKDSDGKPLNIVHTQAAQQFGYPMSLYTY